MTQQFRIVSTSDMRYREAPGKFVYRTQKLFAVIDIGDGMWALIHVPSGYAISPHKDSSTEASQTGREIFALLSPVEINRLFLTKTAESVGDILLPYISSLY